MIEAMLEAELEKRCPPHEPMMLRVYRPTGSREEARTFNVIETTNPTFYGDREEEKVEFLRCAKCGALYEET